MNTIDTVQATYDIVPKIANNIDETTISSTPPSSTTVMTDMTASTAARTTTSPAAAVSTRLGEGATAGIAVGVFFGIAAIIATTFFLLRLKHRTNGTESVVIHGSTLGAVSGLSSDKTSSPEPALTSESLPPITSNRVVVFKIGEHNHRHSEDWRLFFGIGNKWTTKTPTSA